MDKRGQQDAGEGSGSDGTTSGDDSGSDSEEDNGPPDGPPEIGKYRTGLGSSRKLLNSNTNTQCSSGTL